MSSSAALPTPTPTPDEIDDLIYFSRTGDLEGLQELIGTLCTTHACAPSVILASAFDVDEDGLGSQSSLLHYPAANGNVEIVNYLISLLRPASESVGGGDGASVTVGGNNANSSRQLVNHKNVNGNTPLHWAGMNGHLDVVKALVHAGADPSIVNAAGRDAVVESECSAKEGAEACAEWMLKNCDGLEKAFGGGSENDGEEGGVGVAAMDDMVVDGEGGSVGSDAGEGGSGNGARDQAPLNSIQET
ncbi:hypothetical protein A1O3_00349 [Capronia epimyces CBS 606.96]|uniref:Uncharacterized protein n=1 Tax=Capronia epimyces CBS 606.96 TaxID=1182542 RepID=W9ZB83_9EURO|nr:uncharacterized protein A1O3_00349 [Capronia epimyces CBS 606.96]EXJ91799.1 hypothetical protein A1O3_00349 [Capronia epimyces CBS 606.96]